MTNFHPAQSAPVATWQERLPEPRRVYTCDMNCSGPDRRHNSPTSCGDCMPHMAYGDPVAARDAEIAELRAIVANSPAAEKAGGLSPLREFADAVKSLCNDYSSRSGNVYISDVCGCIDALHDQYATPDSPTTAAATGGLPPLPEPAVWQV